MASSTMNAGSEHDIASLQAQIKASRQRLAVLRHTLLSRDSTSKRLNHALANFTTLPAGTNRKSLERVARRAERACRFQQEDVHRSVTGITAFRTKDPDPNAVDEGRVFGIRIDVFDRRERNFVKPYFVFLVKDEGENDQDDETDRGEMMGGEEQATTTASRSPRLSNDSRLRVHRHTIPPFIPLDVLADKYLYQHTRARKPDHPHASSSASHQPRPSPQNISKFASSLRNELTLYHARLSAIATLEARISGPRNNDIDGGPDDGRKRPTRGENLGIESLKRLDAEAKLFELTDIEGSVIRVSISEHDITSDGKIKVAKAIVRTLPASDGGSGGSRYRHVERAVMGGDGSVVGILDRLAGGEVE